MKKDAFKGRVEERRSSNVWLNTVLPLFLCLIFAVLIWLTAVNIPKDDGDPSQTQETERTTEAGS